MLLGNSRQPTLTTKVSMLGSVSTTKNIFGSTRCTKKNTMDAAHKSPCVICLGTFVTSAGACDFIGFCFLFLIFGGLRSSTLAMAYARGARASDHCSILSMQKRYRLTIRFVRNSTGPFWFGPMQLSDFSMLKQNVSFFLKKKHKDDKVYRVSTGTCEVQRGSLQDRSSP